MLELVRILNAATTTRIFDKGVHWHQYFVGVGYVAVDALVWCPRHPAIPKTPRSGCEGCNIQQAKEELEAKIAKRWCAFRKRVVIITKYLDTEHDIAHGFTKDTSAEERAKMCHKTKCGVYAKRTKKLSARLRGWWPLLLDA